MIRTIALTASFLLAGTLPALAQAHPPGHGQGHPHGPGHVRPDSAHHAALHALLHGSWTGSVTSPHGVSRGLDLSVARDSLRKLLVSMSMGQPIRAGLASNFVMDGATIRWTQDLSGASCTASAVLSAVEVPAAMIEGKLACEDGESTFTLRKKTG